LLELDSDKISVENRRARDMGGLISRLYQAILNSKQLRISYYSYSSNTVSERVVDPYALTYRRHAWYLVAFCHERKDTLLFRTNRIKTLEYTGKTFSRPSDFSLKEYMAKSWQAMKGAETEVVVKFDSRIAPLIKEVDWHPTQRIEDLPDGSILYTVTVSGTKEISFWVLSYGQEAEVLSPASLRDELAAVTEKMCQRYRKSQEQ
jgi:predicted DNA-binding transcriptional regulator YafY